MLRPLDQLVRFLRRHRPGGRERLAYLLLLSIVVQPDTRVAPVQRAAERSPGR